MVVFFSRQVSVYLCVSVTYEFSLVQQESETINSNYMNFFFQWWKKFVGMIVFLLLCGPKMEVRMWTDDICI